MKPETKVMMILGVYCMLSATPPAVYSILYTLYYADAIGDSSDLHCVVDITQEGKMKKNLPFDYKKVGLTTKTLPDFLLKNSEKYVDMTLGYKSMMLFGLIVQWILFVTIVFSCFLLIKDGF